MNGRWLGTLAALLCCQACTSGTPPQLTDATYHPKLAAPVDVALPYGTAAIVPGTNLDLGFDSVVEDDRCPQNATCGTPGNAIVRIRVALGSDTPFEVFMDTGVSPSDVSLGVYVITLLDLSPLPETRMPIPQARYNVKLMVESP